MMFRTVFALAGATASLLLGLWLTPEARAGLGGAGDAVALPYPAVLRPSAVPSAPQSPILLAGAKAEPSGRTFPPIDPQRRTADRKLAGMIVGLFLHELGHAMIGELGLPAVGPEEDVADEFAGIIYVLNYQLDPVAMKEVMLGSAEVWRLYDEDRARKGWEPTPWFDEHATDMVRYGKILCTLYGADPEAFEPEMKAAGIPESRWEMCVTDFQKKWRAWETLLRPHRRKIDPRLPGDLPADAPGGKIIVTHGKVYTPFARRMSPLLQSIGLFEGVSEDIEKYYVLPRDLRVNLFDCSEENAWYSEDDHAVTLCYGLISLMSELLFRGVPESQRNDTLTNPRSIDTIPVITGLQPSLPAQSTDTLQRALLGTWQGESMVDGQNVVIRTEFGGDGTFTQLIKQADGFAVTIFGGWSLQPLGSDKGRVASFPTAWSPAEYCSRQDECRTLRFTPESTVFTVIDRNTIEIQGERLTRVE